SLSGRSIGRNRTCAIATVCGNAAAAFPNPLCRLCDPLSSPSMCIAVQPKMHQSRMLARLTDETTIQQLGVDSELDVLFGEDLSAPHYLMFLIRCYGFEAPLESAYSMTAGLERLIDLRE